MNDRVLCEALENLYTIIDFTGSSTIYTTVSHDRLYFDGWLSVLNYAELKADVYTLDKALNRVIQETQEYHQPWNCAKLYDAMVQYILHIKQPT